MSKYIIVLSKKARRILEGLSDDLAEPIHNAIISLEKAPRPIGCKKLKGRDAYRIRTGNYRIIYEIVDEVLIINIVTVGHRKDIYKKR